MLRVKCGGRLDDSFLEGTGVVGRGSAPDPVPDPRDGRCVSELDFR